MAPAAAASSGWVSSEGGAVRVVTSGLSDVAGQLRGALEIRLRPGWKTYWRQPGASGIPPQIDISGSSHLAQVQLLFPPPKRFTDRYASWAGYDHTVALPLIFDLPEPGMAGLVEGTATLGICDEICIPIDAPFSFDAGADPDNPQDTMVVDSAFAALPYAAHEGFRVSRVSRNKGQLLFEVLLPEGISNPSLFVAAAEDVQLGAPELARHKGQSATFSAEILDAPAGTVSTLDYTLVAGDEAVAGTIRLPSLVGTTPLAR